MGNGSKKMLEERNLLLKTTVIDNKFAICPDALICIKTHEHTARNSSTDLFLKITASF